MSPLASECQCSKGKCVLEATRGVQQGDVLGPALLTIALQPTLERLRKINLELFRPLDDSILVETIDN